MYLRCGHRRGRPSDEFVQMVDVPAEAIDMQQIAHGGQALQLRPRVAAISPRQRLVSRLRSLMRAVRGIVRSLPRRSVNLSA